MKKRLSKTTSIWYELFVIVQKNFAISSDPLGGLEWCDSGLFMALRPSNFSPQLLLIYFYHSFLMFCHILSILALLAGLEWCDKGLFMAPSHFSPISFTHNSAAFCFSYLSSFVLIFVNLNLSRPSHLTDVTVHISDLLLLQRKSLARFIAA